MDKEEAKKKQKAKVTVYDYLPFIRVRRIFFAVRKSIEDIEAGANMADTITYHAAVEGVDPRAVTDFVKNAYADKARAEEKRKRTFKHYLLKWRPGTTDTDAAAQWYVLRAKSKKRACENIKRKMGEDCLILRIIECANAETAEKTLLAILRNEGGVKR